MTILRNKEIRNKLIITAVVLILFRIGCAIPVPFINNDMLETLFGSESLLDYADMLTGGALSQCSLFALGITPAINASIIMQLLCVAFDKLREMQQGDVTDREKYDKINKTVGIALSILMAAAYYVVLKNYEALEYTSGRDRIFSAIVICALFVCGSLISLWMSTIIDEIGVGSGMSLLIFAGIITRLSSLPELLGNVVSAGRSGNVLNTAMGIFIILFVLAAVVYICYMTGSEGKIMVTYAGGRSTFLPLKIMYGGVIPVIFATTLLSIPQTIALFLDTDGKAYSYLSAFDSSNWIYIVLCAALIFCMNSYYVTTQFDPVKVSEDLRDHGGIVPGIRPGAATAQYIKKHMNRLIPCGSFALCVIAVIPMIAGMFSTMSISFGGTSLIIVCSVSLEVMNNLRARIADYKYTERQSILA